MGWRQWSLAVCFATALALGPFAAGGHTVVVFTDFSTTYEAGGSWEAATKDLIVLPPNPAGVQRAMFGLMVCDTGAADELTGGASAGGACPGIIVEPGDEVVVHVCEQGALGHENCPDISFGVCVDGDQDALCRFEDEEPMDSLVIHTCGEGPVQGPQTVRFNHSIDKGRGPLLVWIMQEVGGDLGDPLQPRPALCPVQGGYLWGTVVHLTQPVHQCMDGIDNDGNGLADWPDDPGCDSSLDDIELAPFCNDGKDNDGDLLIDYPADPGCSSLTDWTEVEVHAH